MARNITVRLEDDVLRKMQGIALIDDTNLSRVVKDAISQYVRGRASEPGFREKVLERQKELFAPLLAAAEQS